MTAAVLVVDMAVAINCMLSVEDLKFKNDDSVTARFSRMVRRDKPAILSR